MAADPKAQTIRSLREDERDQLAVLYQNAFRRSRDVARSWAQDTVLDNTVAMFEHGRLVSSLVVHDFDCFLGGQEQPLGGIGGVATGADSQGRGYARQIIKAALERMRDRGQAISTLYPFSYRFYRELGWGRSCCVLRYENVQQDNLMRYQEGRLVRVIDPATDLEALAVLHNDVMSYYNLTFTRSKESWMKILSSLIDSNTFLYGVFDVKDGLLGYFDCQNAPLHQSAPFAPEGYVSFTRRMALKDETSVRAMIGFLARLPRHVKNIIIHAPIDIDLQDYMIEPSPGRIHEEQQFRIVMLKEAVERRGYAEGAEGRLIVQIEDKFADWNDGVWEIVLEDGQAIAQRSNEEPMLGAPMDAFSQIFCGFKSASVLAEHGSIEVWHEEALDLCNDWFFDQPAFTQDWF